MQRTARKWLASLLTTSLLCTGCLCNPHGHGGQLIAEYDADSTPTIVRAPYKATYVLYQWQQPPDGPPPHTWMPDREVSELYVRGLGRRESVGFEKGKDGELIAVAGSERIPLGPGHYCWHISTDSEYHGVHRVVHETGEDVVYVATLPVATAVWICMLPVFFSFAGLAGLTMLAS